jgi:hypothetical protein
MNIFKKILKYWITLSSIIGFLVGWIFVSQSSEAKLANAKVINSGTNQAEAVTLPPVTSLDSLTGTDSQQVMETQPFTVIQSTPFQPQLRTGGS